MTQKKALHFLSFGLAITILTVSILIGIFISFKKADSNDLQEIRDSLSIQRGRLEFKHELNNLKRTNAELFDKSHITLNQHIDMLTIANHTRHPCEEGEINGCWKKEVDVYKGDVIALQIHYHNTSPVRLDNVSFNVTRVHLKGSIKMEAILKVKGQLASKDIVQAYFHDCNALNILEGQGDWSTYNNKKIVRHINEIKFLIKDQKFSIGTLRSDESGSIIVRFKAISN